MPREREREAMVARLLPSDASLPGQHWTAASCSTAANVVS